MKNNYSFFTNHACKYFPCHNQPKKEEFNCLFCYCPLYTLGGECLGNFEYNKNVKDCTGCHLPHIPENYEVIVSKLKEMKERR